MNIVRLPQSNTADDIFVNCKYIVWWAASPIFKNYSTVYLQHGPALEIAMSPEELNKLAGIVLSRN